MRTSRPAFSHTLVYREESVDSWINALDSPYLKGWSRYRQFNIFTGIRDCELQDALFLDTIVDSQKPTDALIPAPDKTALKQRHQVLLHLIFAPLRG